MQISLTKPELKRFVEQEIKSGRFSSATDLVEAAVERLMLDQDEMFDVGLLASISRSEQEIKDGDVQDFEQAAKMLREKYIR